MQNEVNPVVFKVVDDIRVNSPKRGITEVIQRMGVRDASEHRADYVWPLPGGGHLLTIWSEFVHVHANGRWFYVETLDTKTRLGGGARNHLQQMRAEARVSALRQMHARHQDCAAVLQINRVPIAELEQNENAEVGVRVKDPERWHVARWMPAGEEQSLSEVAAIGRRPMPKSTNILLDLGWTACSTCKFAVAKPLRTRRRRTHRANRPCRRNLACGFRTKRIETLSRPQQWRT